MQLEHGWRGEVFAPGAGFRPLTGTVALLCDTSSDEQQPLMQPMILGQLRSFLIAVSHSSAFTQ